VFLCDYAVVCALGGLVLVNRLLSENLDRLDGVVGSRIHLSKRYEWDIEDWKSRTQGTDEPESPALGF
jgi:hypothetical protein